jgi:tryptophan halogenase
MPWGWQWHSPAPGRRLDGFAFASALAGEKEARSAAGAEVELVGLRPGRRPQPWRHNVLAIGDAAVAVDPLHWTNLHLAHSAITRALDLLPGRDCHLLALREYNRLTGLETDRVRDYLALHYLASTRLYGPFWKAMARRAHPDGLAHSLQQWQSRASLPFYEEESFSREQWISSLLGMGVTPRQIDHHALALDVAPCVAALERTAAEIASLPARLPAYPDYLRRMTG